VERALFAAFWAFGAICGSPEEVSCEQVTFVQLLPRRLTRIYPIASLVLDTLQECKEINYLYVYIHENLGLKKVLLAVFSKEDDIKIQRNVSLLFSSTLLFPLSSFCLVFVVFVGFIANGSTRFSYFTQTFTYLKW